MAKTFTMLAASVDGFIAGPDDGAELPLGRNGSQLFDFFAAGDTPSGFYPQFRMSSPSVGFFDGLARGTGAVISGRRTYDITNGWGGDSPLPGTPLFVLTHSAPRTRPPR